MSHCDPVRRFMGRRCKPRSASQETCRHRQQRGPGGVSGEVSHGVFPRARSSARHRQLPILCPAGKGRGQLSGKPGSLPSPSCLRSPFQPELSHAVPPLLRPARRRASGGPPVLRVSGAGPDRIPAAPVQLRGRSDLRRRARSHGDGRSGRDRDPLRAGSGRPGAWHLGLVLDRPAAIRDGECRCSASGRQRSQLRKRRRPAPRSGRRAVRMAYRAARQRRHPRPVRRPWHPDLHAALGLRRQGQFRRLGRHPACALFDREPVSGHRRTGADLRCARARCRAARRPARARRGGDRRRAGARPGRCVGGVLVLVCRDGYRPVCRRAGGALRPT